MGREHWDRRGVEEVRPEWFRMGGGGGEEESPDWCLRCLQSRGWQQSCSKSEGGNEGGWCNVSSAERALAWLGAAEHRTVLLESFLAGWTP